MQLRVASYGDAVPLTSALDRELTERYGGGDDVRINPSDFLAPAGVFLIGSIEGRDVACGAVRFLKEGVGEVKRMYVDPSVRGRGLSREVLESLVAWAVEAGYRELWLETGTRQPEAISLYESFGFTGIPPFGQYSDEPDARCYRLVL